MRLLLSFVLILLLNSCSGMKPVDFKDQKPRLIIEEYLSGNVKAMLRLGEFYKIDLAR